MVWIFFDGHNLRSQGVSLRSRLFFLINVVSEPSRLLAFLARLQNRTSLPTKLRFGCRVFSWNHLRSVWRSMFEDYVEFLSCAYITFCEDVLIPRVIRRSHQYIDNRSREYRLGLVSWRYLRQRMLVSCSVCIGQVVRGKFDVAVFQMDVPVHILGKII